MMNGASEVLSRQDGGLRPNDLRISCRPSSPRPHKATFHSAPEESCARAEFRALRPVGCMRGLGGGRAVPRSPTVYRRNAR